MGLRRELRKIQSLQAQRSDAQEEEARRLEELRKRILKGEGTTEDPITDFVVAAHKTFSFEAEKPYRDLTAMLEGREGQPIFVARIKENFHHYREPKSMFETLMHIGFLDSEELGFGVEGLSEDKPYFFAPRLRKPYEELHNVDRFPHVVLPTSRYVLKQTHLISRLHTTSYDKWKLEDGEVKINPIGPIEFLRRGLASLMDNYYFLPEMSIYPQDSNTDTPLDHSGDLRAVVIKVGDEEIREFFENQRVHEVEEYEKALRLLKQ